MKNSLKIGCLITILLLCGSVKSQIKIASNGDVGIGISSPTTKVDVIDGDSRFKMRNTPGYTQFQVANSSTGLSGIYLDAADGDFSGSDYFVLYQENSSLDLRFESMANSGDIVFMLGGGTFGNSLKEKMRIKKSNGYVGIGVTSPTCMLDVGGVIKTQGTVVTSDVRLKENINNVSSSLNNIKLLRPVTYNLIKSSDENFDTISSADIDSLGGEPPIDDQFSIYNRQQIGFIAQEVETVYPEIVFTDERGYKSINYTALIPVLIDAVKEQQIEIDGLRLELDALKEKVNLLISR